MMKENSPFTPGNPVPVELFVGRLDQITLAHRYIKEALTGKLQNLFLTGDRGIGKTSLASFLRFLASSKENMVGVHVFLGGKTTTIEGMVQHIFDKLIKESAEQPWFEKVSKFFQSNIKQIGLFGITLGFSPSEGDLQDILNRFPDVLLNLLKSIEDDKKGIFIALDDINGLADKREFANWYKSFVDEVTTQNRGFPVIIMLIGFPENRDTLANLQPSLMRIFQPIEIERLNDQEVESFFRQAFDKVGIPVDAEAMELMVRFSGGLPILMHEIGDATFWTDTDNKIGMDDATGGVLDAAENIGKKYLGPKVYRAIRSERYRSILRKLASEDIPTEFVKRHVEEKLNGQEKKVFHNFLRRLRKLGVIEPNLQKGRGAYKFVNPIYSLYVYTEAMDAKAE